MRRARRNHNPGSETRNEGTDWSLYYDPARKLAVPGRVGLAPSLGAIIVPRYRRACRAVVERAARRLNSEARKRA